MITSTDITALLTEYAADMETYDTKLASLVEQHRGIRLEIQQERREVRPSKFPLPAERAFRRDLYKYPAWSAKKSTEAARLLEYCRARYEDDPSEAREAELHRVRDLFVVHNMRLVLKKLDKYTKQDDDFRLDLLQECSLSLFDAVDRYEWRRGISFTTYASYWVHERAMNTCYDRHVVKVSRSLQKEARRAASIASTYESLVSEQVAEQLGVSSERADYLLSQDSRRTMSIHGPDDGDDEGEIGDTIEDEGYEVYSPKMEDMSPKDCVAAAMERLLEREQEVIARYYGIGCEAQSMPSIARDLGVSSQRIQQIHRRALGKMSTHKIYSISEPYLPC